ncbi:MAG TPA: IS21 family transposase [Pseudobdellovibrionaceae bacterium]|nr:IS21 family transposase [Pseudobdellovibrionaceae bacterium]
MPGMRTSVEMRNQVLEMNRQGVGIKRIAVALRISKNTVRKILRQSDEEKVAPTNVPPWALTVNWDRVRESVGLGVPVNILHRENVDPKEVSYIKFWRYYKSKNPSSKSVTMVLNHKPGERAFFDFTDGINIKDAKTGEIRKTQLLCGVLAFSSLTFGEFVEDQKLPTMLRGMESVFKYFGGITPYLTVDNLKSGVARAHLYDPDVNPTFVDFANHWGFAVIPARPYRPRDKGKNESAIGVIQRQFYQEVRERTFYSLLELNVEFRKYCDRLNSDKMKDHGDVTRRERFATEQMLLKPLALQDYEISICKDAKVHSDCHVQVEKNFYSVPHIFVGRSVRVRIKTKLVEIFDDSLNVLAVHVKLAGSGKYSTVEAHYPEAKVQASRFEIKYVRAEAAKVGPETVRLIDEIVGGEYPLRYLRRAQGIVRLVQSGQVKPLSLEYASRQAMLFKKTSYGYVKSAAEHYEANGNRPASAKAAPLRSLDEINLHNQH